MSERQKKALEIAIRDAMDGMEALASMASYRRLPDDLEILGIGEEIDLPHPDVNPPMMGSAEVIQLAQYRRPRQTSASLAKLELDLKSSQKYQ